jgi:glutamate-5-semialdehyde dehydrogenase
MQPKNNSDLLEATELRLRAIRKALPQLRQSSLEQRNQVLQRFCELLSERQDDILKSNQIDLDQLKPDMPMAFVERLRLNPERMAQMQKSLIEIIKWPDPIGKIEEQKTLVNGLQLKRVSSPLGVILMIFESRPNVISEAFSLAFKAGNALILRGGSESLNTARILYQIIAQALQENKFDQSLLWGIDDPNRELSQLLMKQKKFIDVLVPRGGDGLIEYVTQNATIPIIKNDRGLCHVYVHEDASEKMAVQIVENAKTQRPGVCNSMETLLLHRSRSAMLPLFYEALKASGTEWFACSESLKILSGSAKVHPIDNQSFDTEYLDYKINVKIVSDLAEALAHIEEHGSKHSECIVTASEATARHFQNSVDAAVVYWNASTRFTDGYEFGLGGELGISTQKLHVRGPVGLRELTSLRWIVDGTGQTRQ